MFKNSYLNSFFFEFKMSKLAVLITGQERSLFQTFPVLYKNVIVPNGATVFIGCETRQPEKVKEFFSGFSDLSLGHLWCTSDFRDSEYQSILNMIMNSNRPGLSVESLRRATENDAAGTNWSAFGMSYIVNGGSIVQYYQIWKLFGHVAEYERTHNMRFDYCMRTRTDVLINEQMIIDPYILQANPHLEKKYDLLKKLGPCVYGDGSVDEMTDEDIRNPYVITFAVELVWIAPRSIFALLCNILFHYGLYDKHTVSFNSEYSFHAFCQSYNIRHFSLYEKYYPMYMYSMSDAQKYLYIILK